MERLKIILVILVILLSMESVAGFLKMNRNNPVVQALLGNKNNQGNQPQQNDNNECVDEHGKKAKTSTVEGCAANKHGGVHSCESQGKEIIWAKVQQKTSLYPCNYQKNPIEYDHAIADGGVFTYDKTTITVAGGCRANFLICYKAADDNVDHGCPAHWWTCNNYCRNVLKCRCGGYCSNWPKRHRGRSCVCLGCKVPKDGPRTCTCKGDPHLTTFDGSHYTIGEDWVRRDKRSLVYDKAKPGCSYYLIKDPKNGIDIIMSTVHCKNSEAKSDAPSRATCVYSMRIMYKNHEYEILHDKQVFIDGGKSPTDLPREGTENECTFNKDADHVIFDCGNIFGKFNGNEVDISDDSDENTEGLCGKKDDKEKVDFKEDLEGFVQDWKVDEKCSDLG